MGVAISWGSTYLAVKDLAKHTPVLAILSSRFLITTLGMLILWAFSKGRITKAEWKVGLLLGCTQALILFMEAFGVTKTSASNGGLIISLAIILTPIMDGIWAKHFLPRPFFIATFVAFVGVALLVSSHGIRTPNIGDFLFLVCAFTRAAHVTALGHMTRGKDFSSLRLTLVQSGVCAIIFTTFGFRQVVHAVPNYNANDWSGILYLSLICTVFAFLAQTWAIRRTSPSRASLLLGTEPVWAVLVAIIIGGESLTALGVIGGLLILSGTYFGEGIETKHRAKQQVH